MKNKLYAVKFREKESKEYLSLLFLCKDEHDFTNQWNSYIKNQEDFDIDKRTISWSGSSIPLHEIEKDKPLVIYRNLDDVT